jgi:hypothetical protein
MPRTIAINAVNMVRPCPQHRITTKISKIVANIPTVISTTPLRAFRRSLLVRFPASAVRGGGQYKLMPETHLKGQCLG